MNYLPQLHLMADRDMHLRDWFAGQALAGLIAPSSRTDPGAFARDAYRIADAMLTERAKGLKP